ncbi:MAG TPA: GNAT family N-acetyltransferase [Anaerolineales bacterium]|nr:GNAT family N-acetyltransferase [Anaerolineales bacterium]
MTDRSEYLLKLSEVPNVNTSPHESTFLIRTTQVKDASLLAELMIDAYRGTIDYDGETFDDALSEVNAFFAGERGGQPWLNISFLAFSDSQLVGACLIGEWKERQSPIIAYLMTSANWKNRGLGRQLLNQGLKEIGDKGFTEVRAVITNGNTPSESLFLKLGFQKVQAL